MNIEFKNEMFIIMCSQCDSMAKFVTNVIDDSLQRYIPFPTFHAPFKLTLKILLFCCCVTGFRLKHGLHFYIFGYLGTQYS